MSIGEARRSGGKRHDRFIGSIAGMGTTSGVRLVVGNWSDGPWGSFADVMVEDQHGYRVLLAPDDRVAEFVASTYSFDEVRIGAVEIVANGPRICVVNDRLRLQFEVGTRTALGRLLRTVPARVATSPTFCSITDPFARIALQGVRTRGSAGGGRREFYGATDVHRVVSAGGRWAGQDLGSIAPVDPPCRFGFSSVPRTPSLTRLVTTVAHP